MGVNLYEQPQQPVVDLDTDVVVYVPGYARKGPGVPTLVNSSSFTALFGSQPYTFVNTQQSVIAQKNNAFPTRPDKSWLYAKGLVDAGLTVLYHRVNPGGIGVAKTTVDVFEIQSATGNASLASLSPAKKFSARAKYFGQFYDDMTVEFSANVPGGTTTVTVSSGTATLESRVVSFNPARNNFIGNIDFTYVEFFIGNPDAATPAVPAQGQEGDEGYVPAVDAGAPGSASTQQLGFDGLALDAWLADSDNAGQALYVEDEATLSLADLAVGTEEFEIPAFEALLEGATAPFKACLDVDKFPSVTYVTTGGYYQSPSIAAALQTLAMDVKAVALVDLPDDVTVSTFTSFQSTLEGLASDISAKAKGAVFLGADTYVIDGYRVVIPDSYGYLLRLANNLSQAIPAWIPPANNPQGVVAAVATTRSVDRSLRVLAETKDGATFNPIIFKQNVGYTIMGNRTTYPNDGVLGPTAFLNCQLVVNSVLRSARRAASDLLIVSTNPSTAFNTFKSAVGKTCDRMLVNGDGLSSYTIKRLPKTLPATMDIAITLVVVEGIEVFEISIQYQLALD